MPTLTIELALAVVTIGWTRAIAAALAAVVGLTLLAVSYRAIRQTTLRSAWGWSLAAVASWGSIEVWLAMQAGAPGFTRGNAIHLAAIALSLCPVVALLGAKRPQDKAWNFVVVAFWIVLILPTAEALLLHPGQRPTFVGVRGWILWVPILLTAVSYLGTRFGLAGLLVAIGQFFALSNSLAMIHRPLAPYASTAGFFLAVTGMATAWFSRVKRRQGGHALDRQWIDFRDALGVFWALRVMERMNAMATQHGWEISLRWDGFKSPRGGEFIAALTTSAQASPQATFRGLLRRFVTSDWLAARARMPPRHDGNEAASDG